LAIFRKGNAMLRELSTKEMEMVSGGHSVEIQDSLDTLSDNLHNAGNVFLAAAPVLGTGAAAALLTPLPGVDEGALGTAAVGSLALGVILHLGGGIIDLGGFFLGVSDPHGTNTGGSGGGGFGGHASAGGGRAPGSGGGGKFTYHSVDCTHAREGTPGCS
jgi:hypothetical protein